MSQDQRFYVAIVGGIVSAVVLGAISGPIRSNIAQMTSLDFSIISWAVAYGVGYTIQKLGRGVQPRFSYLGAACALLAVLISDVTMLFGVDAVFFFRGYEIVVRLLLSDGLNSLLSLAYRAFSVYIGYKVSRVV